MSKLPVLFLDGPSKGIIDNHPSMPLELFVPYIDPLIEAKPLDDNGPIETIGGVHVYARSWFDKEHGVFAVYRYQETRQ